MFYGCIALEVGMDKKVVQKGLKCGMALKMPHIKHSAKAPYFQVICEMLCATVISKCMFTNAICVPKSKHNEPWLCIHMSEAHQE